MSTRTKQLIAVSFSKTVGDVKFKGLLNTLYHSIAVVQAKKSGDTMRDVEDEASVDKLAEVKTEKKLPDNDRYVGRVTPLNAGTHAGGN